ncbi:LRR receptor-like serine/threonine-protein kinase EFR [Hevea brasiliensis]|uniref:LRR receptor-like serine/threonine-protein kinase EFR n=1 Tax=Hevea brasiliensis TaxID=3981 RepID=UPI0025DBE9B4|nr:LRR receptor-like serine/threonine-protein kinase EFR [Hevea brasiliensis]
MARYLVAPWPSVLHFHLIFLFSMSILSLQPEICLSNSMGNVTDRISLLEFKAKIASDPYGILSSWNDSVNFCQWQGVICGPKHHRVVSLNLHGLSLSGTLSPYTGNLTFLRVLNLSDNKFHGEIPQEVGRLFRLRLFYLKNNTLGGEIPINISFCSELRVISLAINRSVGEIPAELGSLKKLVALLLGSNNLKGKIPHSVGNLSSLQGFFVTYNHMEGNIPNELGRITSLTMLGMGINNLVGSIPSTLYNISSIVALSVSDNQLHGRLPANIGLTLPNLQIFQIGGNQFHGSIPDSLTNASQLEIFDISSNRFTGQVPINLGDLNGLQRLNLERNFLGNNSRQDLAFITSLLNCSNLQKLYLADNNFGGALPSTIANMSTLGDLGLGMNQISGRIPADIGNLVNLYRLGMEENLFSGSIPISFGKLQKLQLLSLHTNMLSGQIPQSLGIPELQLPACPKRKKHKKSPTAIILPTIFSSVVLFMTITSLTVFYWRKSKKSRKNPPSNGNNWSRNLNLLQRLRVAIDLSFALHYLHDLCETPIIHCDLKPSNILLDNDMTAHVGDFGLARLLSKTTNTSSQGQTSSIGIKGTIGYMPPEYGIGSEATKDGDVYSFGIILLEIFTGWRPTDEVFTDGLNLHNFVRSKLPGQVMQVLDPKLIATGEVGAKEIVEGKEGDDGQTEIKENNFDVENLKSPGSNMQIVVSVLKIGLACSAEQPGDRMNMRDVTRKLNIITEAFFRARTL